MCVIDLNGSRALGFARKTVEGYNTSMASNANDRQVGGTHYSAKGGKLQHWDLVNLFGWDYFQGQITKYLMRWREKNGLEDLEKAKHFLEKYIEVERAKLAAGDGSEPGPGYVNQDGGRAPLARGSVAPRTCPICHKTFPEMTYSHHICQPR